jgi:hypothetical protein
MRILLVFTLLTCITLTRADEACRSGLHENQRPGPYTSLIAVGPQRGQQHCFICESAARPMVIVFARELSAPLGKLVAKLDKALIAHKDNELRAWVTFLTDDQVSLDPKVVAWSKKYATGIVPLGVFEDPDGPPTYLLAREADVTVLLAVKQKVVANFAFRRGELDDAAIFEIMNTLPKISADKK